MLLVHVTFLFVALLGLTVAVNDSVFPLAKFNEVLFSLTLSTAIVGSVTVTLQVAVLFPSSVVAVIVAVPAAIAVTLPVKSTVATLELLLVHVTFLFVAFVGTTISFK